MYVRLGTRVHKPELRESFVVPELTTDGDRVTGIRGRSSDGSTAITEQARIVIGADGMRSLVARTVQAPSYAEKPAVANALTAISATSR